MLKTIDYFICRIIYKIFNTSGILGYEYILENISGKLKDLFLTGLSKTCPNCKILIKDYEWLQEQYDIINHEVTGYMTSYGYLYSADTVLSLANEYNEKFYSRHFYNIYSIDIMDIIEGCDSKHEAIEQLKEYFENIKDDLE